MAKVCIKYSDLIITNFALLFNKSCFYQNFFKSISRTARVGFNTNDLSNLFITLPPVKEQEKIVRLVRLISSILHQFVKL